MKVYPCVLLPNEMEPLRCFLGVVSCASHVVHLRSLPAIADHFNWCVVPDKSYDAVLFGAMAVLVAVLLQGKYSALWTLIAGMFCGSCVRSLHRQSLYPCMVAHNMP